MTSPACLHPRQMALSTPAHCEAVTGSCRHCTAMPRGRSRRQYATHTLSSSGYHITTGVGSDQVGLFKGEAYVGYQSEIGDVSAFGAISRVAFGGQLHYYPLPELTIDTAFGRSIGVSLLANTAGSIGTSTTVTSIVEQASYQLAQEWSLLGRAGFI